MAGEYGFIKLHRGWRDNDIFRGEFSRADAWIWLIENAAWKESRLRIKGQTVAIERGELSFSQRFMADAWGWSKSRVNRFLDDLRAENMIELASKKRDNSGTTTGTTAGHKAGQGQCIIRLCNYEKYQGLNDAERDNGELETGTTAFENRDKEEELRKKEKRNTNYAFFGRTIRLSENDLTRWRDRYHRVSDIEAELGSLDDWLQGQDESARKGWFHIASASLNKKHQAANRAANDQSDGMENFIV